MALRFSLTERAAGSLACPSAGSTVNANEKALSVIRQAIDACHEGDPNTNW